MNKKKLTINYILNLSYQIIALIIPLITTPYLSKVLGASGVGEYSFTYSLANYFTMLAALGFGTYAQREIAKLQNDKKKISITFWEIFIVKMITTIVSIAINVLFIKLGVYGNYNILMIWWNILIISTGIDINFLFQGLEEFGKIVYKNLAVKIISLILIFIVVKNPNDVWKYIVIYSASILIGNISMWGYCKKYLVSINIKDMKPYKHIGPSIKLFIPTIATSLYAYLDRTMIGLLADNPDFENGCYEQAEKIVKMATTIIISLGTVMIPRNTSLYNEGKIDQLKNNIYFASRYVWAIGLPIMFGVIALSDYIVPWFLGSEFTKSGMIMRLLSPLTVFMGFSNVFGLQYLLPVKKDNQWSIAIMIGLAVNIIVNIILIPRYFSFGASIGTIAAEGTVTIVMAFMTRKFISIKKILLSAKNYILSAVIMYIVVYVGKDYLIQNFINTLILVAGGGTIYFVILYLLKDSFVNAILNTINKYIKKFFENKNN